MIDRETIPREPDCDGRGCELPKVVEFGCINGGNSAAIFISFDKPLTDDELKDFREYIEEWAPWNKPTARDIRLMFGYLDAIDRLTELLRREHFDVPHDRVYGATGASDALREKLLLVASLGHRSRADPRAGGQHAGAEVGFECPGDADGDGLRWRTTQTTGASIIALFTRSTNRAITCGADIQPGSVFGNATTPLTNATSLISAIRGGFSRGHHHYYARRARHAGSALCRADHV